MSQSVQPSPSPPLRAGDAGVVSSRPSSVTRQIGAAWAESWLRSWGEASDGGASPSPDVETTADVPPRGQGGLFAAPTPTRVAAPPPPLFARAHRRAEASPIDIDSAAITWNAIAPGLIDVTVASAVAGMRPAHVQVRAPAWSPEDTLRWASRLAEAPHDLAASREALDAGALCWPMLRAADALGLTWLPVLPAVVRALCPCRSKALVCEHVMAFRRAYGALLRTDPLRAIGWTAAPVAQLRQALERVAAVDPQAAMTDASSEVKGPVPIDWEALARPSGDETTSRLPPSIAAWVDRMCQLALSTSGRSPESTQRQ